MQPICDKRWGAQKPPPGCQIQWGNPLSDRLVGVWLLNEGAGQNVYNLTGMSVVNSQFSATRHPVGLNFATQYVTIPSTWTGFPFVSNRFRNGTFAMRILLHNTTGDQGIFSVANAAGSGNPSILIQKGTGDIQAYCDDNAGYFGTTAISVYRWYDVAITNNGSFHYLYINGRQVGSRAVGTGGAPGRNNIYLGHGYETALAGKMEYCYCWSRCLNISEIKLIMSEPYCVITPSIYRTNYSSGAPPETITMDKWYREASLPRDEIAEVVAYGNMPTAGVAE